jgi:phosphatidylethanolamine/phosphatidyl-N-methylethanolamine N-methyltransferase
MPTDLGLFLRQLLRNPKTVSAMAPSSRWLARAMVAHLGPDTGPVAEFGPGTGIFTRAILAQGVKPANLTLFEVNPEFAAHLRTAFPGVTVVNDGAQTITAHVQDVGAVISGLPLLSFPPDLCQAIYAGAFAALRPGASVTQFTYGPKPPLPDPIRAALNLRVTSGPRIWANLPPARVYTYTAANPDGGSHDRNPQ